MLQPIWLWVRWLRRHLPPHLLQLRRPRLLHQVVLAVAHREQVEQHLAEVLEAPEALLVEVLEGLRELEVLQAQVELLALELLALELLPRVQLEQ